MLCVSAALSTFGPDVDHARHRPPTTPPSATTDGIAALPPAAQTALLAPLRRIAADLDALGRSPRFADTYAGVAIRAAAGTVGVYLTSDAGALLTAAEHADPRADWSRVDTHPARYSKRRLDAAATRLLAQPRLAAGIASVSVPVDGRGLDVVLTPGSRPPVTAADAGVAIRLRPGTPRTAKSWAAAKWHDTTPFIGGDVLTDGRSYCTAGLPAVRRSDGHPILIAAAHCFGTGSTVYTGGGTVGKYYTGVVGTRVGRVTGRIASPWDAAEIDGTNNNADESDTSTWYPLVSAAYSYSGDYVCHDGAHSYYAGHPTPCGIKVTDPDLWFRIAGTFARGVEGVDVLHGWGSIGGDSGGVVFARTSAGRQARGMVSSGGADGTSAQKVVDWVEAPDILQAFGLRLNPVQ